MKTRVKIEKKKYLISFLFILVICTGLTTGQDQSFLFEDPCVTIKQRVDNMVPIVSLDKKVSQMMNRSNAIPNLHIPEYEWWNEALHGVAEPVKPLYFCKPLSYHGGVLLHSSRERENMGACRE